MAVLEMSPAIKNLTDHAKRCQKSKLQHETKFPKLNSNNFLHPFRPLLFVSFSTCIFPFRYHKRLHLSKLKCTPSFPPTFLQNETCNTELEQTTTSPFQHVTISWENLLHYYPIIIKRCNILQMCYWKRYIVLHIKANSLIHLLLSIFRIRFHWLSLRILSRR